MLFTERTSDALKYILPQLKKMKTFKGMSKQQSELDRIFLDLYSDYKTAYLKCKKKYSRSTLKPKIQTITEVNYKKPDFYSGGSFFPEKIFSYIDKRKSYQLIYSGKINGRDVSIIITVFNEILDDEIEEYNGMVERIFPLIYFLSNYSERNCSKTLKVYLYLTEFKKRIPRDLIKVLGPENVNTGMTKRCDLNNEVIIYRKEEWFKVLIHELMHSFGLDFASSIKVRERMGSEFNVESDFLIEEAYVEFWARVLNCLIASFNSLKNKNNSNNFLLNLNFSLQIERIYSIYQCGKILEHMNMRFEDLLDMKNSGTIFREKSNVFSYYILGSILMNSYESFIEWCKQNNVRYYKVKDKQNIIKFNNIDLNQDEYVNFILSCKHIFEKGYIKKYMSIFKYAKKSINNSLTMTIIEIEL